MNQDESLALFAEGRDAWNAWANEVLAERNSWDPGDTSAADRWRQSAISDFSDHVFDCEVSFGGFVFPGKAHFNRATFSDQTWFDAATFSDKAWFYEATFLGAARFERATFSDVAWFDEATFSGPARFDRATFSDKAGFDRATFSDEAGFQGATFSDLTQFEIATFSGRTLFDAATFSDRTWFSAARFSGAARFDEATFLGAALFNGATFSDEAGFKQAVFAGITVFENTAFEGMANFQTIEGKSSFSLADASFVVPPDFGQAHFAEAPRLDNLRIEPQRPWPPTGDPDLAAQWRALKRLAIQGHDHARELEFFKGELLARRFSEDKPHHAMFWFGLFYQVFSDFGRSAIRPLLWWAAGVVGFACLYLGQYLVIAGNQMSGFGWLLRRSTTFVGSQAPTLHCTVGPGDPWIASLSLSLRKGLLFLGLDTTDKLRQIYACLYGAHTELPITLGKLPSSFAPVIPDTVATLGLVQTLYSAALIFLFLLAIRNHFRIG